MGSLELWGGAECTVNRVGDQYGDQLRLTGHHDRAFDIDLIARLGVSALRFPVLWERVWADPANNPAWEWSDQRLARIRELGIRPIVGLVHHGSGPRHTSLVDPSFATGLARFAALVAERYPWVEEWTPVNEPLTTARFSALYGHWYPHMRDERMFWLALVNQIDAVRLAMAAVRRVNSDARLVQTEDLGRTYGTAALVDQAAFDNTRRWMTWDLLEGRVVPGHELWEHLCGHGFERRLRAIADDPCPADVIGLNHYLTSDRFLDHRIARYPPRLHGGNGRRCYVDVEAIRVLEPPPQGMTGALREAWSRYGAPLALTEVHNGCSREEQLRWTRDAWLAAEDARAKGIRVQAVTSWALFGSSDWNTLLTSPGCYESGVFDVRAPHPRRTALAGLLIGLRETTTLPVAVAGEGWWRRTGRHAHPPLVRPAPVSEQLALQNDDGPPLLILGVTGTLGRAMATECRHRGLAHVLVGREIIDVLDPAKIAAALIKYRPWAVINCSGWVRLDEAEAEPELCNAVNAAGAARLARACEDMGIASVTFSSDLVFSGGKGRAYVESDEVAPLNAYGRSKADMERAVLALEGAHLVVRTAAFFSPFDEANFAVQAARALSRGERIAAAECTVTPTFVPDLCGAVLDLLIDGERGLWHLTNGGAVSWAEFANRIAQACALDRSLIEAVPAQQMAWTAPRPTDCTLASERAWIMPSLQSAIDRFQAHFPRL
jgi:dTDP-4-dehydrorhamnose reductase